MKEDTDVRPTAARASQQKRYQFIAIGVCFVLCVLMVLNNQMSGESMWFWYAAIFNHGTKLYADMHTALQPYFVLETSTWMRLFGKRLIVTQIPSVFHALTLAVGIYLVLRESDWPDWQKALVLLGTFCMTVCGHSYRFDDYHVVAETFIVYALLVLLLLCKPVTERKQLWLVAAAGFLCGITTVTRLPDGGALFAASALSLPFLLRRKRLLSIGLLTLIAAVTIYIVVMMTGDTFKAYFFSSVIRAAGSKGGTGTIFAAPLLMARNTLPMLLVTSKRILTVLAAYIAIGYLIARFRKQLIPYIVPIELALAAVTFLIVPYSKKLVLWSGGVISSLVLFLTLAMYLVAAIVAVRMVRALLGKSTWDPREILIIVPIAEWASYSAGAAAEPLTNYYGPVALLLLLIPVVQPLRKQALWLYPSVVTIMTLIAISGIVSKVILPYSWQNYRYDTMFKGREWFDHPVYGPMYIDDGLLDFSRHVCSEIGQGSVIGQSKPELLSIPYPYSNYFCDTPPWHNYVQTFFDTSTRGTIEHLMQELDTAPPQWIIYQRQLNILKGSERLYNHGKPLAQRELDTMIMQKIASGQWTLIEKSDYLAPDNPYDRPDTGWFIIRTHP